MIFSEFASMSPEKIVFGKNRSEDIAELIGYKSLSITLHV